MTITLPRPLRAVSYFWVSYVRTWKGDLGTTFIAPILYLTALGTGVGGLVGHGHALASLGGTYLFFVAPAVLATTAMQVAIARATYEVWSSCNPWKGCYRSMQATPLSVPDILVGHMAWMVVRLFLATACYLAASAAFGAVRSVDAVATLLVGPLVGLAFALPIAAYSVTVRVDAPFSMIFRLLMIPLFLFSGTFFPLSQLPVGLQYAANALPLWHGVRLCRDLYSGNFHLGTTLIDVGYLVAVAAAGLVVARYTYERRLSR